MGIIHLIQIETNQQKFSGMTIKASKPNNSRYQIFNCVSVSTYKSLNSLAPGYLRKIIGKMFG